jgi:hypothetical protein
VSSLGSEELLTAKRLCDRIRACSPKPGLCLQSGCDPGVPGAVGVTDPFFWPDHPGSQLRATRATALRFWEGPPFHPTPNVLLMIEGNIFIGAYDGWVLVQDLRVPGKREMSRREYASGHQRTSDFGTLWPFSHTLSAWYTEQESRLPT